MKLAFINGNIYTKLKPLNVAEAMVIENDKIIFTGDNNTAIKLAEKIINLNGKTLLPGFIDAHMHLDELGMYLNILDLRNTRSIEELREKLREFAKSHPGPIMGHGWDQELFKEKRWPNKNDINDIVNDRPVILTRVCVHAALVNDFFLKSMNFINDTGIVKENEFEIFRKKYNSMIPKEIKRKYILDAIDELIKNGISSIGFVSCNSEIFNILKELDYENKIPIRVNVYLNPEDLDLNINFKNSEHLKLKGIKLFVDGSLGVRTALLSEKYDDEDTYGEQVFSEEFLKNNVKKAILHNLQIAIHAIGDKAMDIAISLLNDFPGNRIEHCSVVRDDQLDKLKNINLVIQPHFIITDYWVLDRVGKRRAKFIYRFKDLANVTNIAFSTDSPVEPINPFLTIQAAVTRGKYENIPISKFPGQELSVEDSIYYYTMGSAIALKEDKIGSLNIGNFADFIILDDDPIKKNINKINEIRVKEIYISGKKLKI